MPRIHAGNSRTPCWFHLQQPVGPNMVLEIQGDVLQPGSDKAFSFNLSSQPDLSEDVDLHFSPRPAKHEIALNTMTKGAWNTETSIKDRGIFEPGKSFILQIKGVDEGYEIFDKNFPQRKLASVPYKDLSRNCKHLLFVGEALIIKAVDIKPVKSH